MHFTNSLEKQKNIIITKLWAQVDIKRTLFIRIQKKSKKLLELVIIYSHFWNIDIIVLKFSL